MRPRSRGIATYIETFTLIGIGVGGSAAVYTAMAGYFTTSTGAYVGVSDVALKQGPSFALEKLVVSVTGGPSVGSFVVSSQIPASTSYCVTVAPTGPEQVGLSPPPAACGSGTTPDPSSIPISLAAPLSPGESLALAVIIYSSNEFVPGEVYTLVVTTSAGAAQGVDALATPA